MLYHLSQITDDISRLACTDPALDFNFILCDFIKSAVFGDLQGSVTSLLATISAVSQISLSLSVGSYAAGETTPWGSRKYKHLPWEVRVQVLTRFLSLPVPLYDRSNKQHHPATPPGGGRDDQKLNSVTNTILCSRSWPRRLASNTI